MFFYTINVHWRLQHNYYPLTCILWILLLLALCNHSMAQSEITETRLLGQVPSFGRVEVLYGETWIPVCHYTESLSGNTWDHEASRVVCQQLGFRAGGMVYEKYSRKYGVSNSSDIPLSVNNVVCDNSDTSLKTCDYKVQTEACSANLQAAVICFEGDIRLVNVGSFNAGRLEILHNDKWGTVCQTHWSKRDARVTCRQIGLPYQSAYATNGAYFGEGFDQIWLSGVKCDGDEDDVGDCEHRGWGSHDGCDHTDDAGIVCSACNDPQPLGMESELILDDQITANSEYNRYKAYNGRLNQHVWWASHSAEPDPWIQVEFYSAVTVAEFRCQGSGTSSYYAWVKLVEIQAGDSELTLNYIMDGEVRKAYTANTDINSTVQIELYVPITTMILRINPIDCHRYCAMRFEIVGCNRMDECFLDNPCDDNAICSDFNDGFKCTCKTGYQGNGFQCEKDITSLPTSTLTTVTESLIVVNTDNSTEIEAPEPLSGSNNTGTIAGVAVGGILVLIIVAVVVVYLVLRRRAQHTTENTTLQFNGPYDITIRGTDQALTTDDSTTHNNQVFVSDPDVDQSNADVYQTVKSNDEHSYAYADSGEPPNPEDTTKDTIYTYAETPSGVHPTAPQQSASSHKGWKENSIYAKSNDHEGSNNQSRPVISDDTDEGWEDNSIYATSGVDDDPPGDHRIQLQGTDVEGWADNDTYGD